MGIHGAGQGYYIECKRRVANWESSNTVTELKQLFFVKGVLMLPHLGRVDRWLT